MLTEATEDSTPSAGTISGGSAFRLVTPRPSGTAAEKVASAVNVSECVTPPTTPHRHHPPQRPPNGEFPFDYSIE